MLRFMFSFRKKTLLSFTVKLCGLRGVRSHRFVDVLLLTKISIRLRKDITSYSRFQTFAVISILYIFFWVFLRRQIVVGRRFGTLCQFHLQRLDVESEV